MKSLHLPHFSVQNVYFYLYWSINYIADGGFKFLNKLEYLHWIFIYYSNSWTVRFNKDYKFVKYNISSRITFVFGFFFLSPYSPTVLHYIKYYICWTFLLNNFMSTDYNAEIYLLYKIYFFLLYNNNILLYYTLYDRF